MIPTSFQPACFQFSRSFIQLFSAAAFMDVEEAAYAYIELSICFFTNKDRIGCKTSNQLIVALARMCVCVMLSLHFVFSHRIEKINIVKYTGSFLLSSELRTMKKNS